MASIAKLVDANELGDFLEEFWKFKDLVEQLEASQTLDLVFCNPPVPTAIDYVKQKNYMSPNSGIYRLDPNHDGNQELISAQTLAAQLLPRVPKSDKSDKSPSKFIINGLDSIEDIKSIHWDKSRRLAVARGEAFLIVLSALQNNNWMTLVSQTVQLPYSDILSICAFSALVQKEFSRLSESNAQLVYDTAKLIALKSLDVPPEYKQDVRKALLDLPSSIKTLPSNRGIEPGKENIDYIMCPECFSLYDIATMEPIYVQHTQHTPVPLPSYIHSHTTASATEGFTDSDDQEDSDEDSESNDVESIGTVREDDKDDEAWLAAEYYQASRAATDGLCIYQYTPSSLPCGALLFKHMESVTNPTHGPSAMATPMKLYTVPKLEQFLQHVLLQPDILRSIREYMDKPQNANSISDILFSPYIQSLKDPEGRTFARWGHGFLNLCLGLYLDWFGPRGNRAGAASYSAGVLYLTILNLPPNLRYEKEFLFPVFIPGPREPPTDGLNHLLRPLVTQLEELFATGFILEENEVELDLIRVRAMLAIIIADIPAACKCGGYASHAHHWFCHRCRLDRTSMGELNTSLWKNISRAEHLTIIENWRDAYSVHERQQIFDQWGVRWTELARLEYLDLTKCFVIDPMHSVLLGIIQNHVRRIFDITGRVESAKRNTSLVKNSVVYPEERVRGEEILSRLYINTRLLDILHNFHSSTLEHLCQQRDIDFLDVKLRAGRPKKRDMVVSLGEWVRKSLYTFNVSHYS
jgi:hypothetical protein